MQSERMEIGALRIASVDALDGDTFGITLESGHTILLEIKDRIHEPTFAALIESGDFCKPRTDGKRIYWPGKIAITLEEIVAMLLSNNNGAPNQDIHKEV